MTTYTVSFEPTATGYSAHVPDLPGRIEFHIEGMRINGHVVPEPAPHNSQI